jgi:hypothetical protein
MRAVAVGFGVALTCNRDSSDAVVVAGATHGALNVVHACGRLQQKLYNRLACLLHVSVGGEGGRGRGVVGERGPGAR